MPWIYNPQPQTQIAKAFDGSQLSFPSREKVYVKPEQMSTYVWNLIRERKLANRGGDPKPVPVPKPVPKPATPKKTEVVADLKPVAKAKDVKVTRSENTDTSSDHHQTHVKVTSESSGSTSAKKESKAEKKQPDILKKADTQGNQETKIEADAEQKPKKRRKRTFSKKKS